MLIFCRVRTRKRLIYPGKQLPKKKKKTKVLSALENDPNDEQNPDETTVSKHNDAADEIEGEKIVRKSTRTSVIVRQAEREAIRATLQATMKVCRAKL